MINGQPAKFFFMILLFSLCISLITSCNQMDQTNYSYLALGDSYTIGEAVTESERWPNQLVTKLKTDEVAVDKPRIIATTGWTTDELISAIEKESLDEVYDIVSLLIGVNNQYRGYAIEQYEREFDQLLSTAIGLAGGQEQNVFVLSIPDYGVTPFSEDKGLDPMKIARELDTYNSIAARICSERNVSFTSITEGSKLAKNDESLVASDGLHPSGKMYTEWVEAVYFKVLDNLSSR